MLLFNILLLTLSALPTSLAKSTRKRHHTTHETTASTFATMTSSSNATMPLTTMSVTSPIAGSPRGDGCPTVTATAVKIDRACPALACRPLDPIPDATSTFVVGCGCPAATPTSTFSQCPEPGCVRTTTWLYSSAGGC